MLPLQQLAMLHARPAVNMQIRMPVLLAQMVNSFRDPIAKLAHLTVLPVLHSPHAQLVQVVINSLEQHAMQILLLVLILV